ncbi:hypothetical protein C8Q75DRAFT_774541 [Abortiporus biennis]|nr:hypothetical protein C8Q75DRAFT_774541 [Abortiporus biennis]
MPSSTAIPDSPTSSSQCIIEPSSLYLDQLHKHFESTRLHVTGERTANYIYDHAHPSDGPLYASLYPPNAHWTAEEKNAFFHSLSVRSRLRPDLIAEDIKTKTIVDVCVYLSMLEEATLDISMNEVESKHKRGSRRKRGRDANPRRALPIAMEMSDQWCLFEEQQARLVVEAENRIQLCSVEELHCAEIEEKRVSLRVKPGDGKDEAGKRDRLGQRFRRKELDAWIDEQREDWEWEKRLNGLDYDTLTIMDRILRDAEDLSFGEPAEVDEEQSKGVEEAECHQNLTLENKSKTLDKTKSGPQHLTPEAEQIDGTIEAASLPIRIPIAFIQSSTDVSSHMQAIPSQTMVQSTFDESMIDPALLALSVQPPISQGAPMTRPNTPPLQTGLNHSSLSFNPITPPFAAHSSPSVACATLPSMPTTDVESTCAEEANSRPTRSGSRRIVRSSALASSPATSNIDLPNLPIPDMRALSPASRKRLRKRMYMRRKRAEQAGTEVNLEMGRLKPGRKSTQIAKTSRRNSQGEEENDGDDEEDDDGNEGEESGVEGTAEGVRSLPVGVKAPLIVAEKSTHLETTATPTVPAEIPESVIEPQKPTDKIELGDVTEVVETDQESTRRSHVSGVTKPYRIRKELEEKGIDAEWLKSQGLDMFHLGTVHKLMQ